MCPFEDKASCTFNLPLSIKSPLHFFNSPFVPAQHSAGVNFGRNVRIAAISDFRRVWPSSRLEWMVKQRDGSLTMRVEGIFPSKAPFRRFEAFKRRPACLEKEVQTTLHNQQASAPKTSKEPRDRFVLNYKRRLKFQALTRKWIWPMPNKTSTM